MTLETPLWLQDTPSDVGYSAAADRALVGAVFHPGVVAPGDLEVTQRGAGANMTVDVAAGSVVVEGTPASRGRYLCRSTAVTSLTVGAAPGAGDTRLDLIYAVVSDAQYSGTDNEWEILLAAGTPDPSPVLPSVPSNGIALASVEVDDATTSITDAKITDLRTYAGEVAYTDRDPDDVTAVDGQLLVRPRTSFPDQLYARVGGAWTEFFSAGSFGFDEATLANLTTAVEVTWDAPVVLDAPGRTVAVQVTHYGVTSGDRYIEVSGDGGATWPHRSINFGSSLAPYCAYAVRVVDPSGDVQARVRCTGDSNSGQLAVLMIPVA